MNPLVLSEAFYAWMFRTKIYRQTVALAAFAGLGWFLSNKLYTNSHPWSWWLALAGTTLCVFVALLFGYLIAKSVLLALAAPFRRPPRPKAVKTTWPSLAVLSFFVGLCMETIVHGSKNYDTTVFWTAVNITGCALILASVVYCVWLLVGSSGDSFADAP